jgi:Asp-tRNA(Asn)/Glu-tRNA(Gln) amidotransferase A subunit family amidase
MAVPAPAALPLPLPEYEGWDATAMAALLRDGQISPLEVLEAAIARAEARVAADGLNAISHCHHEPARAAARQLADLGQAERARLAATAPLLGVPFLIKDLGLALKGTVTSHGCAFFQDAVADHDSTLVQRYQAAGLNIFGKTNSPEFGQTATTESRLYGRTLNPWNRALSSGGSSGGAAVAVAAGVLPVAHASDGGGSIRIPASHCGLFGLKPSRGRLPSGPRMLEGWMGLSTHHVISRTVRDSALFLQLTQGPEPGSRTAPLSDDMLGALQRPPQALRIGLLETNPFGLPVHPDCLEAARRAATLCEALGHRVEPVPLPLPPALVGEMFAGMGVVTTTGLLASVQARERHLGRAVRESDVEAVSWRNLAQARGHSAEQMLAARASFDQVGRLFDLFFARHDLLLSPVTATPPPPLGAQFVAAHGAEARLLALAAQLEQAAPWAARRPPA